MIEKARMIKRRFDNIVSYLSHRITNAASESINETMARTHFAGASPLGRTFEVGDDAEWQNIEWPG